MAGVDSTPEEEWRAIPGFEGYEASSLGRIRSMDRVYTVVSKGVAYERSMQGRILKPYPAGSDRQYLYVSLGAQTKTGVHRLVAMAFVGVPPTDKHEAAHRNGKSMDNRAENLRWSTSKENQADKISHGTYFGRTGAAGELHHKAKLNEEAIHLIRSRYTGKRGERTEIAKLYDVSPSTIGRILAGKGWSQIQWK